MIYTCKRCHTDFVHKSEGLPERCAICRSVYWNTDIKPCSRTELAYVEGIFHSEGCWDPSNKLLRIGNTSTDLINFLKNKFDGHIEPYKQTPMSTKQYYMWILRGYDAEKLVNSFTPPSELKLESLKAYIAGLIDGDGTIYLHKRIRNGREQTTARVIFTSSGTGYAEFIHEKYSGSMSLMQPRPGYREKKPYTYLMIAGDTRVGLILKDILPYLMIKKEKAVEVLNARGLR